MDISIISTTSTKIKFSTNYSQSNLTYQNIRLTYNNSLIIGSLTAPINSNYTFTLTKANDIYEINLINFNLSCNDITTLLVQVGNNTSNTLIIATCEKFTDYATLFPLKLGYMENGTYRISSKLINNIPVIDTDSEPFTLCNNIDLSKSTTTLSASSTNLVIKCTLKTSQNQPIPQGKYRVKFKIKKL